MVMRGIRISSLIVLTTFVFAQTSFAHHGKDYFISKSFHVPLQGEWVGLFSADYVRTGSHLNETIRSYEFEPGILYGITNRWSIELHSHIDKEIGGKWVYESTGLEQRFQITQPSEEESAIPIDIAGALEFEKGNGEHGVDNIQGGLIFSRDGISGLYNLTVNFLLRKELRSGSDLEFRYAVGAKKDFSFNVGAGIELNGTLTKSGELAQQITPGIYFNTDFGMRVKLGASIGLGESRGDYAIRTSIVYDF